MATPATNVTYTVALLVRYVFVYKCNTSMIINEGFQLPTLNVRSAGDFVVKFEHCIATCALQARFKLNKDPTSAIPKCNLSSLLQN